MRTLHRVELLSRGEDEHHEYWCNPDGRITLLRRRGEASWRAVVDHVLVLDPERLNGGLSLVEEHGDTSLKALTPEALAERLALQEHLHVLFEAPRA